MNKKLVITKTLAILLTIQTSCTYQSTEGQMAETDPAYLHEDSITPKIVVYQMMTRLFGNTNTTNRKYGTVAENGVGKFEDINRNALEAIRSLGATHIWYTGVLEHALLTDYSAYGIPPDDADVVKGRAGSPYAIKDYYDVNPDLAVNVSHRKEGFRALLQRTHDAGLKAIMDFVPNHVARRYHSDAKPRGVQDFGAEDDTTVSFAVNNNFYYLPGTSFKVPEGYNPLGEDHSFPTEDGEFNEVPAKATGNDKFSPSPGIDDWFETVKLNYGVDIQQGNTGHFDPVPDTWLKMKDILSYWTGFGVDGFRCDMAEMVPVEFWEWVIPRIRAENPDIIFIAEIYNPARYHDYLDIGHFDFLYDKVQLYDTLKSIIRQEGSAHDITRIWQDLRGINKNMLRFLENHDEQRIASEDFAGDPWQAIPAMVVSATLYTGPVMIYFGQEVGEPGRGDEGFGGEDGRTTIFDYWGVPEHQKWMNKGRFDGGMLNGDQKRLRDTYARLLVLSRENTAIARGDLYDLGPFNIQAKASGYDDKVYAFLRFSGEERVLVIANFDKEKAKDVMLHIPGNALALAGMDKGRYQLKDLLGEAYTTSLATGKESDGMVTEISLEPLESFILKIE